MRPYILSLLLLVSVSAFASDSTLLYNPKANVEKDVAAALVRAKKENKHGDALVGKVY